MAASISWTASPAVVATCACTAHTRGVTTIDELAVAAYRLIRRKFAGRGLTRLAAVRALDEWLRAKLRGPSVVVNGQRMFLDAQDSLDLLGVERWEPHATALVERYVSEGNTVVDVGAHIGYYTLLFAKLVGPAGQVIAFEPYPANHALLQRNVAENGHTNVVMWQQAVADAPGRVAFHVGGADWGHHLYGPQDALTLDVDVVKLDDAVPPDAPVDFLKIDVEGAEAQAFRGMSELLRRSPGLKILTEFWPAGLWRSGTDPGDYLRMLVANGFSLNDVDEIAGKIKPATVADLLASYPPVGNAHTNLLCLRSNLVA